MGWSHFFAGAITHRGIGRREILSLEEHYVELNVAWWDEPGPHWEMNYCRMYEPDPFGDSGPGRRLVGFLFFSGVYSGTGLSLFKVPLWFPTLLLAMLTWWTWRKPRTNDGRGFAVEKAEPTPNAIDH